MQQKFLEKRPSLLYSIIDFTGSSNIFIALCAASLTAWTQKFFLKEFSIDAILLTFSATFLLYNAQRMYLSFFEAKPYSITKWQHKNKYALISLMVLALIGLYPLFEVSKQNAIIYLVSFLLGLFYFLPFSNLRAVPIVKSFTVGIVWALVCVAAPLEKYPWNTEKLFFFITQTIFISALCVLFNIRDTEEDRKSKTYSVPVLFGIEKARFFNYAILLLYLSLSPYVQLSAKMFVVYLITFTISCLFTQKSSLQNHPFYYTFGVDGIILFQSLLGILLL